MPILRSVVVKLSTIAALATFSGAALAIPIVFMGMEDGLFAGDPFENVPSTIVDTTAVQSCGGSCRFVDVSGTTMDLNASDDFTTSAVTVDVVEAATAPSFLSTASIPEAAVGALVEPAAVPEPEGLLLLAVGALGLASTRRRR